MRLSPPTKLSGLLALLGAWLVLLCGALPAGAQGAPSEALHRSPLRSPAGVLRQRAPGSYLGLFETPTGSSSLAEARSERWSSGERRLGGALAQGNLLPPALAEGRVALPRPRLERRPRPRARRQLPRAPPRG